VSVSEWRETNLDEVLSFYNGKKRPTESGNIPVYGGNGILSYCNSYNTEGESLIIGRVGAYCGNVFYENKKCWISDNAILAKAKTNVSCKFMYYILKHTNLNDMHIGSSQPLLTQGILKGLTTTMPRFAEQKAIAATLSVLDDMIELNNQINKTLEEMAQAIFKSWFVDFEPFRDGNFEESELGLIPKGWKVGTFGEVAEITSGKRPVSKQDKETPDFYVPLVGASCIMGYVNEALYNEPIIVIGRVGTHGIVQRFNTQCWPSDNTLVIKSNHYEFAYQILKGIDYRALNRGSTQPLITQTDIKNYKIVIPDSYYLSRFEDTVKTLYKQYTVNNSESRLLERSRDMILPKLINGEIRVPVDEVM